MTATPPADSNLLKDLPTRPWVAIFANPYSGALHNKLRVAELEQLIKAGGLDCRVIWTPQERRALLTHAELTQHCRCVVAAGGDGTISDVINEKNADVPLAVLPLGTENLLAKRLNYAQGVEPLAAAILKGETRRIDLGCIGPSAPLSPWERAGVRAPSDNPPTTQPPAIPSPADTAADPRAGRRFSLMLSMGADAEVVRRLGAWRAAHKDRLRRVRRTSYARHIFATLTRYAYPQIELVADGRTITGTHAFIFNFPCYGLGLTFIPDALEDDGQLDWVVFQRPGSAMGLRYLWSVARQTHLNRPDVIRGRAKSVRVTSAQPVPLQMDGEAIGFTPIQLHVQSRSLAVISAPTLPIQK